MKIVEREANSGRKSIGSRYQRECFRVLWHAFQSKSLATSTEVTQAITLEDIQARDLGLLLATSTEVTQAITHLSGEQVEIKARITNIEQSVLAERLNVFAG